MTTEFQDVRVLGCPVTALVDEAAAKLALSSLIDSGVSGYSVAINAEKITMYSRDDEMHDIIEAAALHVPDGAGAVLGLRWLHKLESRKINFPLVALSAAADNGWPVFVLGATESVNAKACHHISADFPGIKLTGRAQGYSSDEEKIARVLQSDARLVLLALGSPRQERLARRLVSGKRQFFVIGCGGALDVIAGEVKRAPKFMVENNLEWFYRLCSQPSRWRRQLVLVPFFARLLYARLRPGPR